MRRGQWLCHDRATMGRGFLRRAAWLLYWLVGCQASFAAGVADVGVFALPKQGSIELHEVAQTLLSRTAGATPQSFLAMQAPRGLHGVVPFTRDNELWVRLHLRNALPRTGSWHVELALPAADTVTLFQQQGGHWTESSAGDHVPMSQWPIVGRYASFPLQFEPGQERTVVLRIRNAFPIPAPLRIATETTVHRNADVANVGFGLVLGALALLVASCLSQAALYRDLRYFLYALCALLMGLSFAALSGIAGQHLWGNQVPWTDTAKTILPLMGAGVMVWLVSALCSLRTRTRALRRVVVAIGAAVFAMAVAFALMGFVVRPAAAGGFVLACSTGMAVAFSTWRRGDPIGGWVLGAYAPVVLVTLVTVARTLGLAPLDFDGTRWLSVAIALMLPILMMALHLRSKETMALQIRSRELGATDALTGLLGPALFNDRVRAAVARYERSGHDAVLMYVRVANYGRIREVHGGAIADQSMIRCALKVQRLMSDADCSGRVSDDTIGLILEYDTDKAAVQERAAQLIAHGLMAPKGLKPELTLQLHVAANVLSMNALEAGEVHEALSAVLRSMSPRTRRPIRFLDRSSAPEPASALAEEADPQQPAAAL
jgi:GGDEF domain-containing protein